MEWFPRTATLLKETPSQVFSMKFAKFLRKLCFKKHLKWLLQTVSDFASCSFIKKETPAKIFFCEFCKNFKNIFSFDRTTPDGCFLCLTVNFEKFFYRVPLGNCLFDVQDAKVTICKFSKKTPSFSYTPSFVLP